MVGLRANHINIHTNHRLDCMIKDLIALSLTIGLLLLLVVIVLGDFYIALQTNRPIDEDIVNLIQMSITGIVGIISGYVVGRKSKDDKDDEL